MLAVRGYLSKCRSLLQSNRPEIRSLSQIRLSQQTRYSSYNIDGVDLDYSVNIPPNGNETDEPLVILHGLFGSKRNFSSLCKAFMRDLNRPIYALDLRNHGSSPHVTPMDYETMASDVRRFLNMKELKNISLLGHSMGGKVAMALALSPSPPDLSSLVISDIAPTQTSISPSFVRYLDIMSTIEDPSTGVETREHAGKILENVENDLAVRQFLLTNLILPSASDPSRKTVKFQIPISLLAAAIPALGSFPYTEKGGSQWNGKTLVVKGLKSNYIDDQATSVLRKLFPRMKMAALDTGHWVHAEKPNEFKRMVVEFIRG